MARRGSKNDYQKYPPVRKNSKYMLRTWSPTMNTARGPNIHHHIMNTKHLHFDNEQDIHTSSKCREGRGNGLDSNSLFIVNIQDPSTLVLFKSTALPDQQTLQAKQSQATRQLGRWLVSSVINDLTLWPITMWWVTFGSCNSIIAYNLCAGELEVTVVSIRYSYEQHIYPFEQPWSGL